MFVGTYTTGESKGIYGFRFDDTTGTITPVGLVAETANPSFLAASGNRRYLFAVNEVAPAGTVTSFAVDGATGQLHAINTESSRGGSPCHLALDRTGRFLAVANYSSGNFAVLPVTADGHLGPAAAVLANTGSGPNRARQAEPHAHAVTFDATNTFLLGADLGTDRVFVYRFNPVTGATVTNDPASASVEAGSGPRHLVWHPSNRLAFSVNELKSTVTAFAWNAAAGRLAPLASYSTLPDDFQGASATAEIVMHPNGRVLYASNRGHDSIAVFSVDAQGRLGRSQIMPTRGETPRNFAIDPTGRWLIAANQKSGTLAVFRIDGRTGQLSPSGPLVNVAAPVCVLFL